MKKDLSESAQIDEILYSASTGRNLISVKKDDDDVYISAIKKMIGFELITTKGSLTQKGYEVIKSGGFENWRTKVERKENEAHLAVIESSIATSEAAKHAKHSRNAAWFAGITGLLAFLISLYQTLNKNEIEDDVKSLQIRVKTLDSLLEITTVQNKTKGNVHNVDSTQGLRKVHVKKLKTYINHKTDKFPQIQK